MLPLSAEAHTIDHTINAIVAQIRVDPLNQRVQALCTHSGIHKY